MINSVVMVGNLTRDPELKYLPTGNAVCEFTVALNSKRKVGDDIKEEVEFIRTVTFGKTAEACGEHLSKGSLVGVQGRLKFEQWEKDGVKHSTVKVVGDSVKFLGPKKTQESPY